jgi:hypothetical protein
MKKRILALALTVAMVLSLFPGQVFAAQTTEQHTEHNFVEVQPETVAPTEAVTVAPTEAVTVAPTEPVQEQGTVTPEAHVGGLIVQQAQVDNSKSHEHCIYGHNCPMGENCNHEKIIFDKPLTTLGGSLTTGNYYLDAETVNTSGDVHISGNVNICLNGKKIQGNHNVECKVNGTIVHLSDCGGKGVWNCNQFRIGSGSNARFYFMSGTINPSSVSPAISVGQGAASDSTFVLDGGTVTAKANMYFAAVSIGVPGSNCTRFLSGKVLVDRGACGAVDLIDGSDIFEMGQTVYNEDGTISKEKSIPCTVELSTANPADPEIVIYGEEKRIHIKGRLEPPMKTVGNVKAFPHCSRERSSWKHFLTASSSVHGSVQGMMAACPLVIWRFL